MPNIFWNAGVPEARRRAELYAGAIHVDAPLPEGRALGDFARALVRECFAPHDPHTAQDVLRVEEFVERATRLKSTFTNHATTRALLVALLAARGHDPEATYFDVPRLRVVTARGYLTAGVGYAYRAHRDTWYAAPAAQANWWSPLHDLEESQSLVFYPGHFDRAYPNSSEVFDYDEWRADGRKNAHLHVKDDTRKHPLPDTPPAPADEVRLVARADDQIAFSAAQLHATAPNVSATTRFSLDFRTFDAADLRAGRGAVNRDSRARGSTVRDFLHMRTFAPYDVAVAAA